MDIGDELYDSGYWMSVLTADSDDFNLHVILIYSSIEVGLHQEIRSHIGFWI